MDLDRCIRIGSGLAYTFVGYGVLRHLVTTSENSGVGKCTRINLIVGLNSAIATGLLRVYSGIRK
jgi:hypothetical protein